MSGAAKLGTMGQPAWAVIIQKETQPVPQSHRPLSFHLWIWVLILPFLSGVGVAATGDNRLAEISELARAGAPQLALRRLDVLQPGYREDPVAWMSYERERIYLLRAQGRHADLDQRLQQLPEGLSANFRRWALNEWALALLEQGQSEAARARLRGLLWNGEDALPVEQRAHWRRMIIRSYLQEDALDDARSAMIRYQQDFGDAGLEWNLLRAQVLLRTERFDEVPAVLEGHKDMRAKALVVLAQWRGGHTEAQAVYDSARALAQHKGATDEQQGLAWAVALDAARRLAPLILIDTLEHALALPLDGAVDARLFDRDPELLWEAYLDYGQYISNQEQRLLGSDEDWYFPAMEILESDSLRARVMLAVLSQYGSSAHRRELAHDYLVSLLEALAHGERLVQRLYLESQRFADHERLPRVIRYRLIDTALETGDLDLASRLMAGLEEPPQGTDAVKWALRRARVAIHTARPDEGAAVLASVLETGVELAEAQLDRWVQVVFDLQTVQAHRQALTLFDALLERELSPQRRRELLFWQADSWRALKDPAQAAYLYLRSATLPDAAAMDPWAQTARYHAAQALAEAGLLGDARRLYQALLNSTQEPGRRAVLRNEIQRLQLQATAMEERP